MRRVGDVLAITAAFAAIAYGAYLLLIGSDSTFMTPEGVRGTIRSPSLAGLIPLGIGLLALWAVLRHRPIALWAAAGLAATFAALFLFSLSLQFAGLAVLLFVAAALRTVSVRAARQS